MTRVDLMEGGRFPTKWISWGTIKPMRGDYVRSYFLVKLPSSRWRYRPWDDECGWHKLTLIYTSDAGWRFRWMPDD